MKQETTEYINLSKYEDIDKSIPKNLYEVIKKILIFINNADNSY